MTAPSIFSLDMTTQNMVSIKTVLSIRKTGCRLLRYTSFNNNLGNEVELEQSTQKNVNVSLNKPTAPSKTYVAGTQRNHLNETVLLSTSRTFIFE